MYITSPATTAAGAAAATTGDAIRAEGLRKRYGKTNALDGFDLTVPTGTVYGLLGPNGAGKTTAVRILTTLLRFDSGSARVAGFDVVRQPSEVRARIGLTGQYAAVDEILSGRQNLVLFGRLYHLSRREASARADELLDQFGLTSSAGKSVQQYSGGMRRRLDLAASLILAPSVLFLDEPTTGLDPRSRLGLWQTIEDRVAGGSTVLLTTQYLDEADRLADSIAVIDNGTVIAEGTADQLKDRVGGERIELKLEDSSQCSAAVGVLVPMSDERPTVDDGVVSVVPRERRGALTEAVRRLDEHGVMIDDIALRRPTLDDVFLTLTGRPPEDAEAPPEDQAA